MDNDRALKEGYLEELQFEWALLTSMFPKRIIEQEVTKPLFNDIAAYWQEQYFTKAGCVKLD